MVISRIRNLTLINTFAFLLLWSCTTQSVLTPGETQLPEPFIAQVDSSLVYRASFDYKENHFSGLTVFKKTDKQTVRVVFLSEVGLTLMDFEITPEDFIVHKTFDFLDRKIIESFVENDFRLILMTDLFKVKKLKKKEMLDGQAIYTVKGDLKVDYILDQNTKTITKTIRRGSLNTKKATVDYTYSRSGLPSEIFLQCTNVDLNLKLSLLKKI